MTRPKLTPLITPLEAATQVRHINAVNGWGHDFTFAQIPTFLALIHSAISEAFHETQPGLVARELGDVIVRVLDLSELIQPGAAGQWAFPAWFEPDPAGPKPAPGADDTPHQVLLLNLPVSRVLETYRKVAQKAECEAGMLNGLHDVAQHSAALMLRLGETPNRVVIEILNKNALRPYRHGNRRA